MVHTEINEATGMKENIIYLISDWSLVVLGKPTFENNATTQGILIEILPQCMRCVSGPTVAKFRRVDREPYRKR